MLTLISASIMHTATKEFVSLKTETLEPHAHPPLIVPLASSATTKCVSLRGNLAPSATPQSSAAGELDAFPTLQHWISDA